ncbi:N-acetylmuramoyl-L-alanine amidase-like domain-containing protein [Xanthomonas campestris pv. plantaginis]|nr:N-acetylmuramoyl-L-alanine amidase-like domain-containing protein [Xanthomonas campestris]MEA9606734.1 N-acetylmuramoyl-L-alanine amidase-like domain-containing protein [Xanthomonas campestris pv. plantaginis]
MIDVVSAQFLATPYRDHVLQGSATTPEKLIIDFTGLDCFTYLDYVEAARRSYSQQDFVNQLVLTRYVDGIVSFTHRKHFFSDWANRTYELATDITARSAPTVSPWSNNSTSRPMAATTCPGCRWWRGPSPTSPPHTSTRR